jgi:hypothetical protein
MPSDFWCDMGRLIAAPGRNCHFETPRCDVIATKKDEKCVSDLRVGNS